MLKLNEFLIDAQLFALGLWGPKYTWRRGVLWERLDRMLGNSKWLQTFPYTIITHLVMSGSDNRPILCSIQNAVKSGGSPFRFQNMWTLHPNFIKEVTNDWIVNEDYGPWINLCSELGDSIEEDFQKGLQAERDLHNANEELLAHITYNEGFLKQKAAITKFFEGKRLIQADDIAQDVVKFFQQLFNSHPSTRTNVDANLFVDCTDYVSRLTLDQIPSEVEIRATLDSIDDDKTTGPDGFTADDVSIFFKATKNAIRMLYKALMHFQLTSGQKQADKVQ
ncbi:uncharacterized protein LOC110037150 [Phalaenopsis equestris]|uniref:uncharacterized protein LOC110037150 n=1 Tax=Phalaenopsis equestris TaxID=78828 RepID=UPI0009E318D7|nr:uncharacterized protein LOC110037150 [Phalaenopsis equestris]